jgi:ribosome-associated protein
MMIWQPGLKPRLPFFVYRENYCFKKLCEMLIQQDIEMLQAELRFQMSRSSGAGGQHVNKVNTRVELRFDVAGSMVFDQENKDILMHKLANRINSSGELVLFCDTTRSQLRNKEACIERFLDLIFAALQPEKKRIATRPSLSSKRIRVETKKKIGQKKQNRRKPEI